MAGAVKPKAKSPYQRYGKVPTLYSSEYQNWRDAVMGNKDASYADKAWRHRFMPKLGPIDRDEDRAYRRRGDRSWRLSEQPVRRAA